MSAIGSLTNAPAALLKGVSGELEALRGLPGILGELAGTVVALTRSAEQFDDASSGMKQLTERHNALFDDYEDVIREVRLRIESFLRRVDTDELADRAEALLVRAEALMERLPPTLDRGDALVERAPEILDGLARTTDRLDALVDRLDPLLTGAEPLLKSAGPLLESAGPLVERAGPLLDSAEPLLRSAGPLVQRAGPLLDSAEPLLGRAEPAMEDLKATRKHVASMDESMDTLVERMAGFDDSITELEQTVTGMPGAKMAKRRGQRHDDENGNDG